MRIMNTEKLLEMVMVFRFSEDLTIEKRGPDSWCVAAGSSVCINDALEKEYEPMPSWRSEDFIKRTRFSLEKAFELAERYENRA